MLDKYMRTRSGLAVEVLKQNIPVANAAKGTSVICLVHYPDGPTVAYRKANGAHPNGTETLDLVPYNLEAAATAMRTMRPLIFTAVEHLWRGGGVYRTHALSVAIAGTSVERVDMEVYLKQLWGE